MGEVSGLLHRLENGFLGDSNCEDRRLWKRDEMKVFSVKSCFRAISEWHEGSYLDRLIWRSGVPSKVAFLIWLLYQDRVLTTDVLISKGFPMSNRCSMCFCKAESGCHLFIHCLISSIL